MRFKLLLIALVTSIFTTASASPSLIQIFDAKSCDQVLTNGGYFKTCYAYQHKSPDRCWSKLDGNLVFKNSSFGVHFEP